MYLPDTCISHHSTKSLSICLGLGLAGTGVAAGEGAVQRGGTRGGEAEVLAAVVVLHDGAV